MKKISAFILALCLLLTLPACSSKSEEDVAVFFRALHNTMDLDSARVSGEIEMENVIQSSIAFDLEFTQTSSLELALNVSLSSGSNTVEDYLKFYIHDGKTYMDNMGTTSQSLAENIGITSSSRLSALDPFLDFTKQELSEFFTSTHVNGDVYTMKIDPTQLALLLDDLNTVSISKADVTAVINDETIMTSLTLYIEGNQVVNDSRADFKITVQAKVKDIDALQDISFPSDLESYGK